MEQIVQSIPILSALPADVIRRQIDNGSLYLKTYTKGATLNNHKDICATLDIVLSGRFVTYSLAENGSAMQVFEFSKGQMFGANLLFGDNHAYPFTVYCEVEGQILHVTKDTVSDFLHHHDFAMAFIVMLSQNSQRLNQRMRMGIHKTLRENLLEYFYQQARLQGANTIVLPISKKQLADYLGVQRPSLFRELKKLKDEGIIEKQGKSVTIKKSRLE